MPLTLQERIDRRRSLGNSDAHYKWQRRKLWEWNPKCHWCGVRTVLPAKYPVNLAKGDHPYLATIDHLDSRNGSERGKHYGKFRHVLACRRCNQERASREVAAMPRQTLWERSLQIYDIAKRSGAINEVDGWAPQK